MVQPQTAVAYDSQWRSTDVSMVESVNKPDANESSQAAKNGFYEPDDLYLMVSWDSGVEPLVRFSWTPEVDYGTEAQFTKSEPKPAPVETKDQTKESPVKAKAKKVTKPRPLSRFLPTEKWTPFVSRSVVPKSKREQVKMRFKRGWKNLRRTTKENCRKNRSECFYQEACYPKGQRVLVKETKLHLAQKELYKLKE
ncbi:hypothetical protein HanRHA438_Chr00c59g0859701 [Helianthus annuus]|uniref:Uncharacterized protein n=1 Tax=Helianthus annuus TaxID=4232 RepID=A0A251TW24_HELAN|nr:hypothetical protein HanXRQr2_Chr07g0305731 [Helianthus annuus]KAJ0557869.1 hypothetical protein HanIR_Chr07g0330021 [Helianthus annuus]KAJ0563930.1 hypothetical protein HanHA89_Chr07g0268591 [Helianthus annuus]KAJ0732007.1 hypothetical protein HanOQP8_Chr07g0258341 [Helianthus annuus]KAJ0905612.1 hypothetical protein HanPSC8_Chr07g0295941 [Helianthus annuus]